MIHVSALAFLASAALSVKALDIDFVRYSQASCQDAYHIRKDTNLHDPHCKTFSDNEPPFSSFKIHMDDDEDDLVKKDCYVTVYDGRECTGASVKYTQLENFQMQCQSTNKIHGRSVKVSCEDRPTFTSSSSMPTETIHHLSTVGFVSHETFVSTVTNHEVTTMVHRPQMYSTVVVPVDEWDWCPQDVNSYIHSGDNDKKSMRIVKRGTAC